MAAKGSSVPPQVAVVKFRCHLNTVPSRWALWGDHEPLEPSLEIVLPAGLISQTAHMCTAKIYGPGPASMHACCFVIHLGYPKQCKRTRAALVIGQIPRYHPGSLCMHIRPMSKSRNVPY